LSPRGGTGFNPYVGYDSADRPFLYRGSFLEGLPPLAYLVAVDGRHGHWICCDGPDVSRKMI